MTLDSLSLTITAPRVLDGLVFAANTAGMTPEAYAEFLIAQDGKRYADAKGYGVVTSAAFVARFTPAEYGAILAAAEVVAVPEAVVDPDTSEVTNQADIDAAQAANAVAEPVKALLDQLFASPNVALDDPRLQPGLDLLVSEGLLDAGRPAEILSYVRPEPEVTE